jgi:hypothetical protein
LTFHLFPTRSITRTFRPTAIAAAAVLLACAAVRSAESWRDAPEFIGIFTPGAHRGAYHASVSETPLDAVLTGLADDPSLVRTPGAWTPRSRPVLDAFGTSGSYDRWKLARLYGSRQPRVARGARTGEGGITESWLLVSPYPSDDFTQLEPGTLRIVLRIAP